MKQNIKISEIIEFINSDKFDVTFSVAVSLSDYELNSADKIKKAISKIDSMLDNIKFIKKAKKELDRAIDPDSVLNLEIKYYDSSEVVGLRVDNKYWRSGKTIYIELPKWFRGDCSISNAISYIKFVREELKSFRRDFNKEVKSNFVKEFVCKHR